ncbi:MAG: LLM class F420-dependent oxidoreductase [Acidimicrobiia bacterium]
MNVRWGITVPFLGVPLHAHREWYEEAAALGYTNLWSAEADGTDGFSPLLLAAAWTPSLRLGQAILPVYLRGPALLAQSAAALAEAAPGRAVIGIGASSDVIVQRWNGIPFDRPYQRVRDTLRFLRAALAGEKVTADYETFSVRGFRLGRPLPADVPPPPILLAALRPRMLRLAGREADGAIINWLSADDVAKVVPHVGADKEIVCRIFCCPSTDAAAVRQQGRFLLTSYLNVPVYRAFHEWLGRGRALAGMWEAWEAGDRAGALAAVPDEVVDELIVHGSPEECRAHIRRYVENGVTTVALAILPLAGVDQRQALRDLAPA